MEEDRHIGQIEKLEPKKPRMYGAYTPAERATGSAFMASWWRGQPERVAGQRGAKKLHRLRWSRTSCTPGTGGESCSPGGVRAVATGLGPIIYVAE